MKTALEAGCTFWNGGEFYGTPERNSLTLLRAYFDKYPEDADKVVINIKGCCDEKLWPTGDAEGVRRSVENSLRMLGPRGVISQFEFARKDPNTEIEVTMEAFKEQIRAGHIAEVAMSEVNAETIRRAAKVTKIGGVEVELSLWRTDPLTNGVAEACAELGIPIIAYCEFLDPCHIRRERHRERVCVTDL